MVDRLFETAMTIGLAIIGVALIAVIVGRNAQTPGVIQASGGAVSSDLTAAEAPVLGN
jgi:hypothetical protein